jgi:hypothetical protein
MRTRRSGFFKLNSTEIRNRQIFRIGENEGIILVPSKQCLRPELSEFAANRQIFESTQMKPSANWQRPFQAVAYLQDSKSRSAESESRTDRTKLTVGRVFTGRIRPRVRTRRELTDDFVKLGRSICVFGRGGLTPELESSEAMEDQSLTPAGICHG